VTYRMKRRRDRVGRLVWASFDAGVWFCSIYAASWLRLDFVVRPVLVQATLLFGLAAAVLHVLIGTAIGPYRVRHRRGSFEESVDLGQAVVVTGVALTAWAAFVPGAAPRSVPVIASAFALAGMFAGRFLVRSWRNVAALQRLNDRSVIVFGAGDAGQMVLRSMRDEKSGYCPVALLDDDRRKRRLRIDGVAVRGTRADLEAVADKYGATALVVALPLADAKLIRDLTDRASAIGLDTLILPPLREIIGGRPTTGDLRDVNIEDLLGRRPISLDTTVVAEQISGQSVLVTGAGGSIGSELCRQIARFGPAKLYMLDRDESGLLATQMSMTGQGLLQGDEIILADIRDAEAMRAVFAATEPDLVFHAAALKHLPLLETFPLEAWKTNVIGTLNVLAAASEVGVGTFVNISTDKAAAPTCVLGYSKRVAERLTADFARTEPGRYVSVRFGNVLGSRGSVVHTFTAQIERGGPITITHPEVERYFMLIPEACQLVLEAGSIGQDGEVMVLEMGEQVKIVDVAKRLIRMSGRRDIDIRYTGLRPGEKLSEDLFSTGRDRRASTNPLITSEGVPKLEAREVRGVAISSGPQAVAWMRTQTMSHVQNRV
jgi:FlaA1/EpsC-like NDP-sugar epimerase